MISCPCTKTVFMKEFLMISYCGSDLMKLAVLLALNRKIASCHQDFFRLEMPVTGIDLKLSLERSSFDT